MSDQNDLLDPGQMEDGVYSPGVLPNSTATLVLGICSIVGCIFYGVPGIVCGIIAIILHNKDKKLLLGNERKYESSYKNSKAGYICAIIGLSFSALYFLIIIIALLGVLMVGVH